MNAHTEPRLPSIVGGGNVMAIIPQTFEETWRIAKAVFVAGLAPSALIGGKEADDAVSAVAVAIMSGAELGLKPMVALRSFTVINGKPALYGDGLINVVRQSGRVSYLRTGCDTVNGKMVGFCEAKRSDTGEDKRVEFSQDDASRAGLWSPSEIRRGKIWRDGKQVWVDDAPNDSPWHRYPQRMLAWRAAGYCLRELFGDVLGGIRDEFEVREIEGELVDHSDESPARISPPTPPSPPSPPSPDEQQVSAEVSPPSPSSPPSPPSVSREAEEDVIDVGTGEDAKAAQSENGGEFDYGEFFENLQIGFAAAKSEADVEEIWSDMDVEATFQDDPDSRQLADVIKRRRLEKLR